MKAIVHDGHLTDSLAAVIGYLRMGAYDGLRHALEEALHSSAEAFIGRLAEHLRQEEEALFPALEAATPAAGGLLRPLREEHTTLRLFAADLAQRLAANDRDGACEVARSFLAALFEHVDREDRAVDALLDRLQPDTTDRLLRRLGLHRTDAED